ncbi:DNA-binding transcriptional MerR regulator [Serratia fonticola]|uniref:DNA-binding transcriptional MerR regulator n=1 Tax=Serratia fonticola TaxID=47917 RepID=A0A542D5F6_SERFO|nr:MerR family transcriptional regulator [Serratia fonticola]TQI79665.1 DNA-binding transcriptional MerR regulator [Serratia fonticola]TQI98309.1 DNA-binding transcriptional MerR regulator [Serratia fonticola]TVZ67837.1 DNA-binding transcriptional MerR regulator [Serratia fonticola]
MTLYTISEVAKLCAINPVTLRAWQRRYGLLKPQRSEGGHRQFSEADIERIRAILSWIERGVPVSKIKPLLEGANPDSNTNWAALQQQILTLLNAPAPTRLRHRIFELGREYPAEALIDHVLRPLRSQLAGPHELLQMLRGLLDGVIIEYATFCMIGARKKPGENALLLSWGKADPAELWMAAIALAKAGMHIDMLAEPLEHPALSLLKADRYFINVDGPLNSIRRKQLATWRQAGLDITLIGSSALLAEAVEYRHEFA